MCETCGCGQPEAIPGHAHDHDHSHEDHDHRVIEVRKGVLEENSKMAERNRGYLEGKHAISLNVVGSPGSGKTSLLEKTCLELGSRYPLAVIEGDQQSDLDAERIRATGTPSIQINTGYGCHLDARMVNESLKQLEIREHGIIFIENVGNLVCPSLFDLGETERVLVMSVTEGDDKPLKYPYMFLSAHLCLVTKTDLVPYLDCDLERLKENIRQVHSHMEIIPVSVKTGEGMDQWLAWLNRLQEH
jgi:hydrogenase nickel incorporation protein HypB